MSSKTDFSQIVSSEMRKLSKDDCNGALPYLLLTSKSESIVRDLLAFRLHEKFQGKNYVVAREWSRADIAVLAPVLGEGTKQFKDPKAIIEIKMVAAPGKDNKNVYMHFERLERQLRNRKVKWKAAECFGLLAVRIFSETYLNSTSAFDEVIGYREDSLKPLPDLDSAVMNRAKDLRLSLAKQGTGTLMCGEEKVLQARVSLKWWLFSL